MPPPGAWDSHFHIFGPSDKFPVSRRDAAIRRRTRRSSGSLRCSTISASPTASSCRAMRTATTIAWCSMRLTRFPQRLRGVAITDTRIEPEVLRDWHKIGMRGLRFHLFPQAPNYRARRRPRRVRSVPQDDGRSRLGRAVLLRSPHARADSGGAARDFARHAGDRRSSRHGAGARRASAIRISRRCLKLVGDGHAYVKLSAVYRLLRRNIRIMPTRGRCMTRSCAPIQSG